MMDSTAAQAAARCISDLLIENSELRKELSMKFRAVLIRPGADPQQKHDQTFHSSLKSAEKWAGVSLRNTDKGQRAGYKVNIYLRTEVAHGFVDGKDIE